MRKAPGSTYVAIVRAPAGCKSMRQDITKGAREEAEARATKDAEATKMAHERELTEFKAAHKEAERARKIIEGELDKAKGPLKLKDPFGNRIICP